MNPIKKLTLHRETLRDLTEEQLKQVAGGYWTDYSCNTHCATACNHSACWCL